MSRVVPNSYQKPNLYTDRLMRFLTGDEWKTLDYALRRTFGWQKMQDRISISQFRNGNGRLDEDGYPLEYGTGLSQGSQIEAINELMRFGILIEVAPNNPRKEGRLWALQLDEGLIRFDLIRARSEAQQTANRRKTARAREAAVERRSGPPARPARLTRATVATARPVDNSIGLSVRPMIPVCGTDRYRSVGQTDTGLTDRPIPVCGTDTQKHSKKPNGNPVETHPKREGRAAGGVKAVKVEGADGMVVAWGELVALCDGDEAAATQVWRLQEKFAAVTKLKRPDPATVAGRAELRANWWPNLKLVLADADNDPAAAEAAMQEAFASMVQRPEPLNVVSPRSIVKVTSGVLARQRRGGDGQPRGDGGQRPTTGGTAARPRGFAGIDAYIERRGGVRGN